MSVTTIRGMPPLARHAFAYSCYLPACWRPIAPVQRGSISIAGEEVLRG